MKMMSPRDLNTDPRRWLDVPHELHSAVLGLQEKIFPGFTEKLREGKIHCLECDGYEPFVVVIKSTNKPATCDGYVGDTDSEVLLHTV